MPSVAEERRSGAELQVLLGGSVCAQVDRGVDEAARHEERHRCEECSPETQPQPGMRAADGGS